jgi:hypothetical protein
MAQAMSDLTINESGTSKSSYEESWAEGGGGASVSLFGIIEIGGGGGGGSYDSDRIRVKVCCSWSTRKKCNLYR